MKMYWVGLKFMELTPQMQYILVGSDRQPNWFDLKSLERSIHYHIIFSVINKKNIIRIIKVYENKGC